MATTLPLPALHSHREPAHPHLQSVSHYLPLRPHPLSSEMGPHPSQPRSRPQRWAWWQGTPPYLGQASLCLWASTRDPGITELEGRPSGQSPPNLSASWSQCPSSCHPPTSPSKSVVGTVLQSPSLGCPDWSEGLPALVGGRWQSLCWCLSWALGRLTSPRTPGTGSGNFS